jgi:hypothetical protein
MRTSLLLLSTVLVAAAACSTTINITPPGTAAGKEKMSADKVKTFATKTPPANGTSMGMMTKPRAGKVNIPIENTEVYQFSANVSLLPDADPEILFWAATADAVYVWGQIDLVCVDDQDKETGETGQADFVFEADDNGYGWLTSTDSCGYTTIFGCSADGGAAEVCGGCDFNAEFIVCAAGES